MDRKKYTGESTTFGGAQGQEMIAPEVNKTNILMMTAHLRKVGYAIPPEYDDYIMQAPDWYQRKYMQALQNLSSNNSSPILKISKSFKEAIEKSTGLSLENFVDTSIKVMDGK